MSDDLTIDDLTVVGIDGIRRSFDEHYDTTMCVEQDPTGAHHAIQTQHARIEELEAERNEADVAALERILKERGRVFDAMVDAAEDAAGKGVSFNVVVGRAIRAALAELKGKQP